MRILFFTHTRLGDAILSTGVIRHFSTLYPHARFTVVGSPLVAGIFAAMPMVEKVIAVKKRKYAGHWMDVWKQTVATRWDVVVDLRNSAVSRLLLAGKRHIWSSQPDHLHKVEQIASVIGVNPPPSPVLFFDDVAKKKAVDFLDGIAHPRYVIAPVANWIGKTWPPEKFIALINQLSAENSDARFIIMAGPGEEAVAGQVLAACPQGRGVDAIARFSPLEAAAVIAGCDAFVGNDSGLMHAAAATGIPTLGLFGPSKRSVYRPWGANARMVETPESFEELQARPGYSPHMTTTLMDSLRVETVKAAFGDLLKNIKR